MIDRSGSMAEELVFCGRRIPKAEAVAEVANGLLFELIQRATRTDGVRDYYDIAVIGYDGDGVRSLLSPEHWFVPVSELAARETPQRTVTVERTLPSGERTLHDVTAPCWITPSSRGTTPCMRRYAGCQELVEGWCARPAMRTAFRRWCSTHRRRILRRRRAGAPRRLPGASAERPPPTEAYL